MQLKSIMTVMEEVPISLLFIDACRNNPFAKKFRDYAAMFKSIPASLALSGVPGEFCGQVDEYDAGLVRKVQASMNAKGITSGKPDGSLGPNTRKAIRRIGKDLLGRDVAGIEPDLLLALGLPEEEFRQYVLCR
ncbi:MAG: hypothetical protein ABJL00_02420 [Roseibium sp.]|uniref:peptidoglycan-binding domain-containing protein n=2 Tax=Roseibium sp. TaxID=1936156 RepID=UPI003263A947